MKERFLRWLNAKAEKNWHKVIDKQLRRVSDAYGDLWVAESTLKVLVDRYNKIYGAKLKFDYTTEVEEDIEDD